MRLAPLALPLTLALAGCSGEALLHGLDEPQANDVLVALDEGGIAAEKAREDGADAGWEVRVAPADAVLAKGSMVPTATEEHALYLHALSGELARSIEAIDGVVGARVHLGLPQADPFRPGERPAPRAAVLVRCRAAACAAVRTLEPGLRALVAGAADGLDAAAVSVVFAEAPQASAPPPPPRRGRSPVLLALAAAAGAAAIAVGGGAGVRWRRGKPS